MARPRLPFGFLAASLACAPHSAPGPAPSSHPLSEADSFHITRITPGVTHTFARELQGPWAIHVVEIDARRCVPVIRARKAGPTLAGRARTSVLGANDLAAVNADFFQLPGGTPVGAHVTERRVLAGPGTRPVFAAGDDGYWTGVAELAGFAATASDTARVIQVNRPPESVTDVAGGLIYHDAWSGDSIATPAVRIRMFAGDTRDGRGVVLDARVDSGTVRLGERTAGLHARGSAVSWIARRAPGDTVSLRIGIVSSVGGRSAEEVVGGFPLLVREGRNVVAEASISASFAGRHPRTAVGWTADGARLFWVVVDGRQAPWSSGMSLDELAQLMTRIGSHHAINLDGGGSTTMIVRGVVVNRPSDAAGERAVGNALALEACSGRRP